ncbi:hypothetical protein [Tamaricihabitans halophyticus]|uniref:hypothetical protein n=1 Tax=Tamaricihabitans halophyticus TaxID=1262583 RepID=UPI003C753556
MQLLTGAGFSLEEVGETLDRQAGVPLVETYSEQVRLLEIAELRLRYQRIVLAAATQVLREHPHAPVQARRQARCAIGISAATYDPLQRTELCGRNRPAVSESSQVNKVDGAEAITSDRSSPRSEPGPGSHAATSSTGCWTQRPAPGRVLCRDVLRRVTDPRRRSTSRPGADMECARERVEASLGEHLHRGSSPTRRPCMDRRRPPARASRTETSGARRGPPRAVPAGAHRDAARPPRTIWPRQCRAPLPRRAGR